MEFGAVRVHRHDRPGRCGKPRPLVSLRLGRIPDVEGLGGRAPWSARIFTDADSASPGAIGSNGAPACCGGQEPRPACSTACTLGVDRRGSQRVRCKRFGAAASPADRHRNRCRPREGVGQRSVVALDAIAMKGLFEPAVDEHRQSHATSTEGAFREVGVRARHRRRDDIGEVSAGRGHRRSAARHPPRPGSGRRQALAGVGPQRKLRIQGGPRDWRTSSASTRSSGPAGARAHERVGPGVLVAEKWPQR